MAQLTQVTQVAAASYNLTTLGTADWLVCTNSNTLERKNVTPVIIRETYPTAGVGEGFVDTGPTSSWTDGTTTTSGSGSNGRDHDRYEQPKGYKFTVPAGTGIRTFKFMWTGYFGDARIAFALSDASATLADVVVARPGNDVVINETTVTFQSTGPTATLSVIITNENGDGPTSIRFWSAALSTGATEPDATALVFTPPTSTSIANGAQSSAFTYTANGAVTGTKRVTPAATGGGTFSPTFFDITNSSRVASFQYTPASTGTKTISVTNNGSLTNPSSFTFTVTPVSVTLAGSDGGVGVPVNITVGADGPIPPGTTATLSVTGGGSFSPSATVSLPGTVQYTASTAGSKTISATNTGGLVAPNAIMLNFAVVPVPVPTASSSGVVVVKVGSGTGQDYATLDALRAALPGLTLKTSNVRMIAEVYQDFTISGNYSLNPAEQDSTHYIEIRPVPGLDYARRNPSGAFDPAMPGQTISITAFAKAGMGVVFRGFKFNISGAGELDFGGPAPGAIGYPSYVCGAPQCFISFSTSQPYVSEFGEYNVGPDFTNTIFYRTAGSARLNGGGPVNLTSATIINRSASTATILALQNETGIAKDIVFVGCGPAPYATSPCVPINCVTDTAMTTPVTGITVSTSPSLIINAVSDLRPNGAAVGTGSVSVRATPDNRNANRGQTPDRGALQLTAAAPLPTLTLTSVTGGGQDKTVNIATTNTPTAVTCSLIADPSVSNNQAIAQGPFSATLTTNNASQLFPNVAPGSYVVTASGSNAGGPAQDVSGLAFKILGISGSPSAPDSGFVAPPENPPIVTGVTITPVSPTVQGLGTVQLAASVQGSNSPSQAVRWVKESGTGSVNTVGQFTADIATFADQFSSIRATSLQNESFSGVVTVKTMALDAPVSTVTSVTVTPGTVSIIVGASQQFTAVVNGLLNPSQAVTWSISQGGTISASGLATCPIGVYTVTATSQQNNTKIGTALFSVQSPGSASLPPDIGLNTLIVQDTYGFDTIIG